MANPTVIKLQDGNVMPQLGLGVWQIAKLDQGKRLGPDPDQFGG